VPHHRLPVAPGLPLQLLGDRDGLRGTAGLVEGERQVVLHGQLEVAAVALVGQPGRLAVALDGVLERAAGAEGVGEPEQQVGARRDVGRLVEQVHGGDRVLEHQRRVADPAEQRREPPVALREQLGLASWLGPGPHLAHDPGAVLGVAELRLGGALDQQQALVGDAVRLVAAAVEELPRLRQRSPRVGAEHHLQLVEIDRCLGHPVSPPMTSRRARTCATMQYGSPSAVRTLAACTSTGMLLPSA
jgi:hypothetical protein